MEPTGLVNPPPVRQHPTLQPLPDQPVESISFVVVHFSDEYIHNFLASECVHQPHHQIITIDNRGNCQYENLSMAVNAGIAQAQHEIIAVIHEDVLLPRYWEQHLFQAIQALDASSISWGLLGAVGWIHHQETLVKSEICGHWSDPNSYTNTLDDRISQRVDSLDEQLMIIKRSQGVLLDARLPSIHNIGLDLPLIMQKLGYSTFVINAPTIHKYANHDGDLILQPAESPKIMDRKSLAYLADKSLSDDYLRRKWENHKHIRNHHKPSIHSTVYTIRSKALNSIKKINEKKQRIKTTLITRGIVKDSIDPPILLIAKGGGGSRLLSSLAADLGIFIGDKINQSGDALDIVHTVYRSVLRHCLSKTFPRETWRTIEELRHIANFFVSPDVRLQQPWGFKLPESILILRELLIAFPNARVIHLLRDPLTTSLRRTHMTARLDNQIGRATLPCAYRHLELPPFQALNDHAFVRNAYTTKHQLETALSILTPLPANRVLEIRFEELLNTPDSAITRASAWLNVTASGNTLKESICAARAEPKISSADADATAAATAILHKLRVRLGYIQADQS